MNTEEQKAFAEFLVKKKRIVSSEQLQKSIEVQREMTKWGIKKTIDKVIVEKNYVDGDKMASLVKEFMGGDEEFLPGYRVKKKLGEGAMGEVFEAIDMENDNRAVAIKILYPHLAKRKATAQRFLREANLCMSKLNHPNIVRGYEAGYEGERDCFFYAMELIEGGNLRKIFKEKGPFSESLCLKIMVQIASALEHAFQFNLVHRDIKPDNIMLTPHGEAKLCDLGLARNWAHDMSLTRTGAVMGTPYYISPEAACASEKLDCRSDIYSFGATMYHVSVGRVPFPGNNSHVVLTRHLTAPLIPPIEAHPSLSPDFSAILQMMMEKAPEDRYQSPTELLKDLNRLQSGQITTALPRYNDLPAYQVITAEEAIEITDELECPSAEIMMVEEGEITPKRQDSVEEYFVAQRGRANISPKQQAIWRNFFTSSEQRALSNAQTAQSKLLALGAVIGGLALIGTIMLCYVLIKILSRLL